MPTLPRRRKMPHAPRNQLKLPQTTDKANHKAQAQIRQRAQRQNLQRQQIRPTLPKIHPTTHKHLLQSSLTRKLLNKRKPNMLSSIAKMRQRHIIIIRRSLQQQSTQAKPPNLSMLPTLQSRPRQPQANPKMQSHHKPIHIHSLQSPQQQAHATLPQYTITNISRSPISANIRRHHNNIAKHQLHNNPRE